MMHHFTHQAIDGRWHAVYRLPACESLHSVCDAPTKATAQEICDRMNAEQRAKERAAQAAAVPPDERRIPRGFYSDAEAA